MTDERQKDAKDKLSKIDALLAKDASAEDLFSAATKARLALEFRATDAMIGLPELDARLTSALRKATCKALARAADKAHVDAALAFGEWVIQEKDDVHATSAVQGLQRVADLDRSGRAYRLLGYLAFHGLGHPQDYRASLGYHRKGAGKGDVESMFELYAMLAQGLGAKADMGQALAWCKRAADAGQPRAMSNLAAFYATGRGLPKDEKKAVAWYEKAANAGHAKAAGTLGVMLASGQGAPLDRVRARKWLERADTLGYDWRPLAHAARVDIDALLRLPEGTVSENDPAPPRKKKAAAKAPAKKTKPVAKKKKAKAPAKKKKPVAKKKKATKKKR